MDQILKYRNQIYGFLALWIIFFHIDGKVGPLVDVPILTPFVQMGNCGVDIFMFLSGICLSLSLQRDENLKHFYAKRFRRVVISYLIVAVPFFFWRSIAAYETHKILHFFYNVSTLSFWTQGVQTVWFVDAILFFYLLTPFLFKIVKRGILSSILLIIAIYAFLFIGHWFIPNFEMSEIAWTRLPAFALGIIMGYYQHLWHKHDKWIAITAGIYLLVILAIPARNVILQHFSPFWLWAFYISVIFPVLYLFMPLLSVFHAKTNKALKACGDVSLELYLVHITILFIFGHYGLTTLIGRWLYIVLPLISIPTAFGIQILSTNKTTR